MADKHPAYRKRSDRSRNVLRSPIPESIEGWEQQNADITRKVNSAILRNHEKLMNNV
jgi:hypothetical protein